VPRHVVKSLRLHLHDSECFAFACPHMSTDTTMDGVFRKIDLWHENHLFREIFKTMREYESTEVVPDRVLCKLVDSLAALPAEYKVPFSVGRAYMRIIIDNTDTMIQDMIPRIMACHRDHLPIQENACSFLKYAFNSERMLLPTIAPCFAAVVNSMQTHFGDPKAHVLMLKALFALDSMTRGLDTTQLLALPCTVCNVNVVDRILSLLTRTPFLNHDNINIYEDTMQLGCLVISRLAPGWRAPAHANPKSLDNDILHGMLNFPENYLLQESACAALAALAKLNLDKFTHIATCIQYVANTFQVAANDMHCENMCATALSHFAFDHAKQSSVSANQSAIGKCGVFALACASLKRYYDRNTNAVVHVEAMCTILRMLSRLVHKHRHNKQRTIFSNYHGLLLGIVTMRRKQSGFSNIEVECMRLLCSITVDVFEDEKKQTEIITSSGSLRTITSPNAKNRTTGTTTLIAAALSAIAKKGAPLCMIVDCFDMLGHCAKIPALRATIGSEGITIVARLMLLCRKSNAAANDMDSSDTTRLGMVILEGMSYDRVFAMHPDLQKAAGVSTMATLTDNSKHCPVRDSVRHNVQHAMQHNEMQS